MAAGKNTSKSDDSTVHRITSFLHAPSNRFGGQEVTKQKRPRAKEGQEKLRLMGLEAAGGEEGYGFRDGGVDEEGVGKTLVRGERGVVEAPIREVVCGGVAVPLGGRRV